MRLFGYQKDNDELLRLEEISLQCSIEELQKIIDFLNKTRTEHAAVESKTDICHSHFRDWDPEWKKSDPDIVVVTKFKE